MRRAILLFALFAVARAGAAAEDRDRTIRALAEPLAGDGPLLRIGLEPAPAVALSSSEPFRIVHVQSGEPVWRATHAGEIRVLVESAGTETDGATGSAPAPAVVFRVQVGAFGSREAAERERRRLERATGVEGVVRHEPERGIWRVRLGRATDRLALAPLIERLRRDGYDDPWVTEDDAAAPRRARGGLRLVDAAYESRLTGLERLLAIPAPGALLRLGERSYRGLLELRIARSGGVQPINWIGLESYLLGVVPAELGPEVWPELEALKAQSVAARTYAWRQRGQFAEDGYDLCATPQCQVYGGAGAEHPLSTRAVRETRGEILTWEDRPILALYTATCGGHTEDGREIFPERDEPYLRGVACRAEEQGPGSRVVLLGARPPRAVVDETGTDVTREWLLLAQAGVLGDVASEKANDPLDESRLRKWTGRLARLAGIDVPRGETVTDALTLGQATTRLLADVGWSRRAELLLSREDVPALLRDPGAGTLAPAEERAMAYLASLGALRPFSDGRYRASEPATAARLAPALVRIGDAYRAFGLESAVVAGGEENRLRLKRGVEELAHPVDRRATLLDLAGGRLVPVERLELWPGDRVGYRLGAAGAIDFIEVQPPVKGVSDDRSAKVYSWEVRRTRAEVEARAARLVSVGSLVDLRPVRRGVSGRVVELEVVGERDRVVVRGLDVRRLLDLQESLTVIEVERDDAGGLEAVVFAGKGWGHGVGLCQVGAYGMAVRGATHAQILRHYYTGAELAQLASVPAGAP